MGYFGNTTKQSRSSSQKTLRETIARGVSFLVQSKSRGLPVGRPIVITVTDRKGAGRTDGGQHTMQTIDAIVSKLRSSRTQ